jgi:hypothetical protein
VRVRRRLVGMAHGVTARACGERGFRRASDDRVLPGPTSRNTRWGAVRRGWRCRRRTGRCCAGGDPVLGVGRLGVGDPRAGAVRHPRDLRLRAAGCPQEGGTRRARDRAGGCGRRCGCFTRWASTPMLPAWRGQPSSAGVAARGDRQVGGVDRGQVEPALVEQGLQLVGGERHGEHAAGGARPSAGRAARPGRGSPRSRSCRPRRPRCSRRRCGRSARSAAPAAPISSCASAYSTMKQRAAAATGVLQLLGRRATVVALAEQQRAQVDRGVSSEQLQPVSTSARNVLGVVQVGGHARVLRPAAGEHEHHWAARCRACACTPGAGSAGRAGRSPRCVSAATAHGARRSAWRPSSSVKATSARSSSGCSRRCFARPGGRRRARHGCGPTAPAAATAVLRGARRRSGRFLQHDEGVGAAHAERVDAGAARAAAGAATRAACR